MSCVQAHSSLLLDSFKSCKSPMMSGNGLALAGKGLTCCRCKQPVLSAAAEVAGDGRLAGAAWPLNLSRSCRDRGSNSLKCFACSALVLCIGASGLPVVTTKPAGSEQQEELMQCACQVHKGTVFD